MNPTLPGTKITNVHPKGKSYSRVHLLEIEENTNAALRLMKSERRPVMSNGFRAKSVAYSANGYFEVATDHGHAEFASAEDVQSWLRA